MIKDGIKVRMAIIDEDIWPQPSVTKTLPADPEDRVGFSKYIFGGRVVFEDVGKFYYEQTRYSIQIKSPLSKHNIIITIVNY